MIKKRLGKLTNVEFGWGGYQEVQFGLSVTIDMDGSMVNDFNGGWGHPPTEYTKWTAEEQREWMAASVVYIRDLLTAAGKTDIIQLNGVPVEATLDSNMLKSWRILTEVL